MEDKTLRQVCDWLDVSRRAVQGYEKAGLVSASGKTKRGYLLYDSSSQNRIKQIRLFQQLGFSIKEIQAIIDSPNVILREQLERQIEKLHCEKKEVERLIEIAQEMLSEL